MVLILRALTGEYRINQIVDLLGVGTVWCFPNDVANIPSQHRMVINSGQDIKFSTKKYHKSGNLWGLKYDCVTSEGVKVTFAPNKEWLHILDCRNYSSLG